MQLAADRNMLPLRQQVLIGGLHVRHFNLAEPAKSKLRSREPPLQPLAHLAFLDRPQRCVAAHQPD